MLAEKSSGEKKKIQTSQRKWCGGVYGSYCSRATLKHKVDFVQRLGRGQCPRKRPKLSSSVSKLRAASETKKWFRFSCFPLPDQCTSLHCSGSCNYDQIVYVQDFPSAGATIYGTSYATGFGGKGADQCVMAAKLGAVTAMVNDLLSFCACARVHLLKVC